MSYVQQNISDINDIPGMIVSFANARGWTTGASSVTVPGGRTFDLSTNKAGTPVDGVHKLIITDNADASRKLHVNSPQLAGTSGSPTMKAPTKLHMFGNNTPWTNTVPYIAVVVEYGFNNYRHFYIGKINKRGSFTGGDILSGNFHGWNSTSGAVNWTDSMNRRLFGAFFSGDENASGGVVVDHTDNINVWRKFRFFSTQSDRFLDLEGKEVFGGHGDGINDPLVKASYASFSASTILVPVNLYGSDGDDGVNFTIHPIGHVEGASLCDMRNIEVGDSVLVGSQTWRVFPEFRKSTEVSYTKTQGFYWDNELSYMTGIAYRED